MSLPQPLAPTIGGYQLARPFEPLNDTTLDELSIDGLSCLLMP